MKRMTDERLADIEGFFTVGDDYDQELWRAIKAERAEVEMQGRNIFLLNQKIVELQKKVCLHTEITFNAENCVYMCDQCDERVYPSPPFTEAGIVYTTYPDAL
jgi:hypothetical protein